MRRNRRLTDYSTRGTAKEILMKRLIALIVIGVTLGCWGVSSAGADELGLGCYQQGGVNLNGPSYGWWYGCSPTSAGMMMGYYDIHGYAGLSYSNLVPGGVAEASTTYGDAAWDARVKTTIASQGYVNDYYRYRQSRQWVVDNNAGFTAVDGSGDDVKHPTRTANCLADYMGSGQDWAGNVNGSTAFYIYTDGTKMYAKDIVADHLMVTRNGVNESKDGMLGMDLYFRSAGYGTSVALANDMNFYTQLIYSTSAPNGCTFADYKALINAGKVAMIQVEGHSMFGYGYTDDGQIIFDDTWNDHGLTMAWGGSYDGMAQWGITVFDPTGGSAAPLPSTLLLMVSGLAGLVVWRRRFGQQ
jgi:hypothetical protein